MCPPRAWPCHDVSGLIEKKTEVVPVRQPCSPAPFGAPPTGRLDCNAAQLDRPVLLYWRCRGFHARRDVGGVRFWPDDRRNRLVSQTRGREGKKWRRRLGAEETERRRLLVLRSETAVKLWRPAPGGGWLRVGKEQEGLLRVVLRLMQATCCRRGWMSARREHKTDALEQPGRR